MSQPDCMWPDCDRSAEYRGLCPRDYARAKRAGRLEEFQRSSSCVQCGQPFGQVARSRQAYCSAACRSRAHLERHGTWTAICEACQKPISRGKRQDSRFCSETCQKTTITHLRRAARLSIEAEAISAAGVIARCGTTCHLCQEPIDLTVVRPDLMSFSIDHLVPLSAGGTHTYSNVAPAHLLCNMRKGNRLLAATGGDAK